jgi:quinoprotein relay system zinc metallohydrolase 1
MPAWTRLILFGFLLPELLLASPIYHLQPQEVAPDTYVLFGLKEGLTQKNHGNIVNTAFLVTEEGVLVLDSGPSKRYGEELREAIAQVTDQPIAAVWITHHHPDHAFGNQAFDLKRVHALPQTIEGLKAQGPGFLDNLYRLVGSAMQGTDVALPGQVLEPGVVEFGGHRLRKIALHGHTGADLAVFDETTGVLFAGDLVFHNRALATPHAQIAPWLESLNRLEQLPFRLLIPGHGEPAPDAAPIQQTRRHLNWLHDVLARASLQGRHMNEIMQTQIPEEFEDITLFREELARSVVHLYPKYEAQTLIFIETEE